MISRSVLVLLLSIGAFAQNVVHYSTTDENLKYLCATAEPVAHLKAGEILDQHARLLWQEARRHAQHGEERHPASWPFYVEGAEPGDMLAVKTLDLQVDGDIGVGRVLTRIRFRVQKAIGHHIPSNSVYCPHEERSPEGIQLGGNKTWNEEDYRTNDGTDQDGGYIEQVQFLS